MYEDVAIAAYLIVTWEQERSKHGTKELQSFIDLGCGNGLLVHILNSEGVRMLSCVFIMKIKMFRIYPNHYAVPWKRSGH